MEVGKILFNVFNYVLVGYLLKGCMKKFYDNVKDGT